MGVLNQPSIEGDNQVTWLIQMKFFNNRRTPERDDQLLRQHGPLELWHLGWLENFGVAWPSDVKRSHRYQVQQVLMFIFFPCEGIVNNIGLE